MSKPDFENLKIVFSDKFENRIMFKTVYNYLRRKHGIKAEDLAEILGHKNNTRVNNLNKAKGGSTAKPEEYKKIIEAFPDAAFHFEESKELDLGDMLVDLLVNIDKQTKETKLLKEEQKETNNLLRELIKIQRGNS